MPFQGRLHMPFQLLIPSGIDSGMGTMIVLGARRLVVAADDDDDDDVPVTHYLRTVW